VAAILLTAATLASSASAELMVDGYVGAAFHSKRRIEGNIAGTPLTAPKVFWDTSVTVGIRAGYWLPGGLDWLGVALESGYFGSQGNPKGSTMLRELDLHVVPITPLVLLRAPLAKSEDYPHGRIQPYVGVGPGLFTTTLRATQQTNAQTGFDVGVDYRAGMTVLIRPRVGVFSEYRYTDIDVDADGSGSRLRYRLETSHINVGVTLRF
jgi:opacity protein-like surface antigen